MQQVFISYSSKDQDFSELLKMKLEKENLNVWMDTGDLAPGDEWRDAIDRGISSSSVVLIVLTPNSCASPYVTYEWAYAIGKGIGIIPILREAAVLHPRLEVYHYMDFTSGKKYPWIDLVDRVQKYNDTLNPENPAQQTITDLSVEDLKNIIHGVVSLASAEAKSEQSIDSDSNLMTASHSMLTALRTPNRSILRSSRTTVLWVDDRPSNNVFEREAMESLGYEFTIALSTDDALQQLEKNDYSIVISDMGRAEGSREGYVLLKKIRDMGYRMPFFIYAGSNLPEHKREALARGAQGFTNRAHELFELVTSV